MSQPRKAMKSLGFQGCCLRCDAEDIPGLKRCNNCIEAHKKVKNILLGDDDSQYREDPQIDLCFRFFCVSNYNYLV